MTVANIKSYWSSGNLIFASKDSTFKMVRFGITDLPVQVKIHNRPTTSGSSLEVRAEPSAAAAEHAAVDSTLDWDATGDSITGGYSRAVQGVARVDAGNTISGGTLQGLYGQVALNASAVVNGSVLMNAIYGLIEDGGTYTEVNHLSVAWLDSHLTKAVSAGNTEFMFISNNGTTTFDAVFNIYAGHKITNLFKIATANTMVSANTVGDATFANWKTIKVDLDGVTHYLIAAQAITG